MMPAGTLSLQCSSECGGFCAEKKVNEIVP